DFLVLLDEINRCNVPKVLGDLLMALEVTKRARWNTVTEQWEDGAVVTLPYSSSLLFVPDNLYIVGTMNTSDRSVAPLDAALRRRFAFVRMEPIANDDLAAAVEAR